MTTESPLTPISVRTMFFPHSYQQEISRDIKWFASWANHYYNQGGPSIGFAAMQILPIAILLCPVINIVTYLAMAYIFQGKSHALCKSAMEEENALAAYIMTERGANITCQNSSGHTLLDLFALKGEANRGFTDQDLRICEILFQKGVAGNYSKKGFKMMLDVALKKNRQELTLHLVSVGLNPSTSWWNYIPKHHPQAIALPSEFKEPISTLQNLPFKLTELSQIASEQSLKKFSEKDNPLFQVQRVFRQSTGNCPLILGDNQVERDSLTYQLVRKIIQGHVPEKLRKKRVFELDLNHLRARYSITDSLLEAGTELNKLTQALKQTPNAILYIHGFEIFEANHLSHTYIKQAIGDWIKSGQVIFSMQPSIYTRHFAKNESFQKATTSVKVAKPSKQETLPIMHQMKWELEAQHHLTFASSAIETAINLTHYLPHGKLPQTPYELLDAAASLFKDQDINGSITFQEAVQKREKIAFDLQIFKLRNGSAPKKHVEYLEQELSKQDAYIKKLIEQDKQEKIQKTDYQELIAKQAYLKSMGETFQKDLSDLIDDINDKLASYEEHKKRSNIKFEVDRDLIASVVSTRSGIPLDRVRGAEKEKLLMLEDTLSKEVIGQPRAVKKIASSLKTARLGLYNEMKPALVCLCAGTSGTGKTQMGKAIARTIFGDEKNMTRLDMSEYQEKESKSRLIGAPPGYVGYTEGGQLTEALKRNPYQVILIDEVEKAAPSILTTFLQVFSDGRLTDGQGNTVDCSQAVFVMTTNLGAHDITASQTKRYIFSNRPTPKEIIDRALAKSQHFSDELLGRMEVVVFDPLTKLEDIEKIAEKTLQQHQKQVMEKKGIDLNWTANVSKQLAKSGASIRFGVRPLVKKIEDLILNTIAQLELDNQLVEGSSIMFDYDINLQSFTNTIC